MRKSIFHRQVLNLSRTKMLLLISTVLILIMITIFLRNPTSIRDDEHARSLNDREIFKPISGLIEDFLGT